ncbi:teichoic acid transport system permease protein [Kribbella sp. VKM Ac-2527]|uniref:Transport permease protein n=1 Tax=Kribbella caucasensis TaxID=2512215 RepID=A0A4R6KJ59_9ACTN|nr:ABC transporter permease [Kribbella sp. VKM Ac-2527]TDO51308.1 teichoic acid transport system permease protein [Kribbella sp. VKM Ac-2527]
MSTAAESAKTAEMAAVAERYGLSRSSARPEFRGYLRDLWGRRQFIYTYARARTYALYAGARLGSIWQLLTPLLNAAVYYLAFGVLLGTAKGIHNYPAFLICGMFVFTYTQRSMTEGSRAISTNLSLIRTLHFPRATLPLAYVVNELNQMFISMGILLVMVGVSDGLALRWFLIIPALLLQTMFNIGMTLIFARLGTFLTDISQLLPFITRTWLYASGIFFSIPDKLAALDAPGWVIHVLALNPISAYIDIARRALLEEHARHALPNAWPIAVGWAVISLVGGFIYFWRAEDRYGRG